MAETVEGVIQPEFGRDYSLEEDAEWKKVSIAVGCVVEFSILASSILCIEEAWAALLVESVDLSMEGSLVLTGRSSQERMESSAPCPQKTSTFIFANKTYAQTKTLL